MPSSLNILITGARAPVALELTRQFAERGHQVFLADSVYLPIARSSKYVAKYFRVPSPALKTREFVDTVKTIVLQHRIDLIIPTCEEAFFISRFRDELGTKVFVDSFAQMRRVHSKKMFLEIAQGCGLMIPATALLASTADRDRLLERSENLVFKREFSRFASDVSIGPTIAELKKLEIDPANPWLAQSRLVGKEYCSYSVVQNGKVTAHACYHSKYRVGKGSGIYFEVARDPRILCFVKELAEKINYHGQIGFDFIDCADGLYVIECNPRATSGAHLFRDLGRLADSFLDSMTAAPELIDAPKMVAPIMLMNNLAIEWRKKKLRGFIRSFRDARDVVFDRQDPLPFFFQFLSLAEITFRSLFSRKSLTAAATTDIEWNGSDIP